MKIKYTREYVSGLELTPLSALWHSCCHWVENADLLAEGAKLNTPNLWYEYDPELVDCTAGTCACCRLYHNDCQACPLPEKCGRYDSSPWFVFARNPTPANAMEMAQYLYRLYKKAGGKKAMPKRRTK